MNINISPNEAVCGIWQLTIDLPHDGQYIFTGHTQGGIVAAAVDYMLQDPRIRIMASSLGADVSVDVVAQVNGSPEQLAWIAANVHDDIDADEVS